MQAKLLFQRFSQIAVLAKAAFANSAVQSAVPTAAYVQHMLRAPLYFVLKDVGPAMAPTINDGIAERAVGHVRVSGIRARALFFNVLPHPICSQAVLFRSLCVLDPVRVGDIVAVSSPPLPLEACAISSHSAATSSALAMGIRRVAAVAGDELIASDDGEVMVVPPGCVWLTCDNSTGDVALRIDSRLVGPVSLYDVLGRALSIVAAGSRPASLSSSAQSVSEDLKWARSASHA